MRKGGTMSLLIPTIIAVKNSEGLGWAWEIHLGGVVSKSNNLDYNHPAVAIESATDWLESVCAGTILHEKIVAKVRTTTTTVENL
jgi:hypothetical protein